METTEKDRAKGGVVLHLRAEAKARAGRKARAGGKAATAREWHVESRRQPMAHSPRPECKQSRSSPGVFELPQHRIWK